MIFVESSRVLKPFIQYRFESGHCFIRLPRNVRAGRIQPRCQLAYLCHSCRFSIRVGCQVERFFPIAFSLGNFFFASHLFVSSGLSIQCGYWNKNVFYLHNVFASLFRDNNTVWIPWHGMRGEREYDNVRVLLCLL